MVAKVRLACAIVFVGLSGCMGGGSGPAVVPPGAPSGPVTVVDKAGDATAEFDVVQVLLTETPEALLVKLDVKSLPDASMGFVATQNLRWAWWAVCWNPNGSPGAVTINSMEECVELDAEVANGVVDFRAFYYLDINEGCNDWAWCMMTIPTKVTAGSPGTIEWTLPRELMARGDAGDYLNATHAFTFSREHDASAEAMGQRQVYVQVQNPAQPIYQRFPPLGAAQADSAGAGPSLQFGSEAVPWTATASSVLVTDAANDVGGGAEGSRPDLDARKVELVESADALTLKVEIGDINAAARHSLYALMGFPGRVFEGWYDLEVGQPPKAGGGYCSDEQCENYVEVAVTAKITPGKPGSVELGFPRAELPELHIGDRVNVFELYLDEPYLPRPPQPPGPVRAYVFPYGPGDFVLGAVPYALTMGAPANATA